MFVGVLSFAFNLLTLFVVCLCLFLWHVFTACSMSIHFDLIVHRVVVLVPVVIFGVYLLDQLLRWVVILCLSLQTRNLPNRRRF